MVIPFKAADLYFFADPWLFLQYSTTKIKKQKNSCSNEPPRGILGVVDAVIVKIPFARFVCFLSKIARVSPQTVFHKNLGQAVQVFLYRIFA
jgi:hypothetical protein